MKKFVLLFSALTCTPFFAYAAAHQEIVPAQKIKPKIFQPHSLKFLSAKKLSAFIKNDITQNATDDKEKDIETTLLIKDQLATQAPQEIQTYVQNVTRLTYTLKQVDKTLYAWLLNCVNCNEKDLFNILMQEYHLDINTPILFFNIPLLQHAVGTNNSEMIPHILSYKPKINNIINDQTALKMAVITGNIEIAQLLIHSNADVNLKTNGHSLLMLLAKLPGLETEKLRSKDFRALFQALAQRERAVTHIIPMANLLLNNGAKTEYKDKNEHTAADLARISGRADVAQLIENWQPTKQAP